jgi:hypothetical protein
MKRFDKDGRLIIPLNQRSEDVSPQKENAVRYVIKEAYCPQGCNIIDPAYELNGSPGLRIGFRRKGMEGEFIISAIEGDFTKTILTGELKEGVKDELFCPHCKTLFMKLVNCNCKPDADMVVIGLTPELDYNNSVTFCNVTGCENGSFVFSGDVIRHIRLKGTTGY